ncbi:MAG: hypothetical protein L3J67_07540 [Hyphomicrobiaceae bacterium]|nr:hypothetical protein [Hyphomicrobiaceae bacterium]
MKEARKFEGLVLIDDQKATFAIKLLAGDFTADAEVGQALVLGHSIVFPTLATWFRLYGVEYGLTQIKEFEIVSRDSKRTNSGVILPAGIVGAVVAGPVGAVGLGALANTNHGLVQFIITFNDGKRFLGEVENEHAAQFQFLLAPFLREAA